MRSIASPKFPRRSGRCVLPETSMALYRLLLRLTVELAILWRLLSLVLFVMPRQATSKLYQVDVLPVQHDLAHLAVVAI